MINPFGLEAFLECAGVCDRAAFETLFSDCYCGVNLVADPNSYSSRVIPAKVWDYLQYLLPVLVTAYVGPTAETIRERRIGLVTAPDTDAVASALIELFEERSACVQNIQRFLRTRSSTGLVQLLCPDASGHGSPAAIAAADMAGDEGKR